VLLDSKMMGGLSRLIVQSAPLRAFNSLPSMSSLISPTFVGIKLSIDLVRTISVFKTFSFVSQIVEPPPSSETIDRVTSSFASWCDVIATFCGWMLYFSLAKMLPHSW